jgi:p-aminobenzoyl-glutamate transporter AbgT
MSPRVLRWLSNVERLGNKLPDPALLFVLFMGLVWLLSAVLAHVQFDVVDPRTKAPLVVNSLLSPAALVTTFTELVRVFTGFQPLGVVLVVMLGAGVAEHAGLVQAVLKGLLAVTPSRALVPMVAVVGVLSHTAADAGFVVVIPLAGVVFHAAGASPAGRHRAGVRGGVGRVQRLVRAQRAGPTAPRLHAVGGTADRPRLSRQPTLRILLYGQLRRAGGGGLLVGHREGRGAASRRHARGR